jgi:hypothetical protein
MKRRLNPLRLNPIKKALGVGPFLTVHIFYLVLVRGFRHEKQHLTIVHVRVIVYYIHYRRVRVRSVVPDQLFSIE